MEDDKTAFNSGIAKLKRIDALRQDISNCRKMGDYKGWFQDLIGIRTEISEKLKLTEEAICDKHEKNIKSFINSQWKDIISSMLQSYDIFLSKIEYKYGYSMPDSTRAGKALR